MNETSKLIGAAIFGALISATIAYALTEEKLWNSWFDATDNTIRVVIVEE